MQESQDSVSLATIMCICFKFGLLQRIHDSGALNLREASDPIVDPTLRAVEAKRDPNRTLVRRVVTPRWDLMRFGPTTRNEFLHLLGKCQTNLALSSEMNKYFCVAWSRLSSFRPSQMLRQGETKINSTEWDATLTDYSELTTENQETYNTFLESIGDFQTRGWIRFSIKCSETEQSGFRKLIFDGVGVLKLHMKLAFFQIPRILVSVCT